MMECQLELKGNPRREEASVIISRQISVQPYGGTKLGEKYKIERNDSPSTCSHHKVVKGRGNIPEKSKALHHRQQTRSKEDELVKYMSSLPTFLERGEKIEEKAFNFGVLEWGRLEKWQDNHRHVPHRSAKSSPSNSNSNASSSSSTEGSSSNCGRGHSSSPARQRMHYSVAHANSSSSPNKTFSRSIRSFEVNGKKFQDLAASSSNYVRVSQSILSTHKCFHKYTNNQSKESTNKDQNPMCISKKRESQTENSSMKLQDCEPFEVKGKLLSPIHPSAQSIDTDRAELLDKKGGLESKSRVTSEASVAVEHLQGRMEANQESFSDISQYDASKMSSDMPLSCPLPREANTFMNEKPHSTAAKIIRSPDPPGYSGKFSASPSRDGSQEGKKSIHTFSRSTEALSLKLSPEEDSKVRHPSPIRRLVSRIGRNKNFKDTSSILLSSPDADKFRSRGAETDASSGDSSCEKSNLSGKGRSSPLRRLLDPLIKPRASNVNNSIGSPQGDASSVGIACQLSKGQEEPVTRHPVKVKLDLGSCKTIDVDHPQDIGKCRPRMVQALFQVAVKNGLPLFTFAVDNSSDILAATMRKLNSARKDGNKWMYTFFTVHEMKKKKNGGWLHQESKDRSLGYIPNVVAQMKVSDVASTDLDRPNSLDQCITRECVLVATKNRQGDEQMSDLHTNDELAAIVLRLPKVTSKDLSLVEQKICKVEVLSKMDLKGSSQEIFDMPNGMKLEEVRSSGKNLNRFGLAVVLPDGDHGFPNEGEPSPLLQRWRSGSCDCGGWDLGCKLKVLASQYGRASVPVTAQFSTGKFQLYAQNGGLDRKPTFSLSPFKDGIYSVDFDSSLTLLQAFSICIAVLNGMQPAKFSEMGTFFEKKFSGSLLSESETSLHGGREEHS